MLACPGTIVARLLFVRNFPVQVVYDSPEASQTVFHNFDYVRKKVKASNVMVYGAYKVGDQRLSKFIGEVPDNANSQRDSPDDVGERRKVRISLS